MMAFFVKLLFNKMDTLTFPTAANYVKMIAFAAALDAARKKKIPMKISEFVLWSNEWLGPDFIAVEKKRSVILFDQKHSRQWLDRPVQNFYTTLLKQSYLSIILRKLKRDELATIERMAKGFSREIELYLKANSDGVKLISEDSEVPRFDSAGILWDLWLEVAK
jgi:hypothetical protein